MTPTLKVALVSDVHANYPALKQVLKDAKAAKVTDLWVLGDVLGRGPLPVSCINLLDTWHPSIWLMGNHDKVTLDYYYRLAEDKITSQHLVMKGSDESVLAKWHAVQLYLGLKPKRVKLLNQAPNWQAACEGRIYAAHGAILSSDPHEILNIGSSAYIKPYNAQNAATNTLKNIRDNLAPPIRPHLLVHGHTHETGYAYPKNWENIEPGSIQWQPYNQGVKIGEEYELSFLEAESQPWLICPGSVGEIRTPGTPPNLAGYAILEVKEDRYVLEFRQVEYELGEYLAAMALVDPQSRERSRAIIRDLYTLVPENLAAQTGEQENE